MDRKDINFLKTTIESYDGMAVVRTLDSKEAVIELLIAPGCEILISELLESLKKQEGLHIDEKTQ